MKKKVMIELSPVEPQQTRKSPMEIMEDELHELEPCTCTAPMVTVGSNQILRQGYKLCGRCDRIIVASIWCH